MTKGPEFSKKTIDTLARRAVQCCSNPKCQKYTSGPSSDPGRAVNKGEAAHIRGAKPGSARFDPHMTDEQRRDISNGIWLCVDCATMIDKDEKKFPPKDLYIWKQIHEDKVDEGRKSYDINALEALQRLQRENEELKRENEELQRENMEIRHQLKAKDDWENTKKMYNLVETELGGMVWRFSAHPEHYACPKCFEEGNRQILQGRYVARCPNCKNDFSIRKTPRTSIRQPSYQNPLSGIWHKEF